MGLGKQAAAAIAAAMMACVSGAAMAQQAAPTATEGQAYAVLDYLFEFAHARDGLDAKFQAGVADEPEVAALLEGFRFDLSALLHAMAERVAPQIAADEMTTCTAFLASPRGDQLMAMSRSEATFDALIPKLSVMPASETQEMEAFMGAPCMLKLLAYMNSPEGTTLAGEAGQSQACAFVLPKLDAEQKQRVLGGGFCKD